MCYFTAYNSDLNRALHVIWWHFLQSIINILFNDVQKWKRLHFIVKKN